MVGVHSPLPRPPLDMREEKTKKEAVSKANIGF
jgi:hypothetical protein